MELEFMPNDDKPWWKRSPVASAALVGLSVIYIALIATEILCNQ